MIGSVTAYIFGCRKRRSLGRSISDFGGKQHWEKKKLRLGLLAELKQQRREPRVENSRSADDSGWYRRFPAPHHRGRW